METAERVARRTARLARQIVINEDGTELDVRRLLRVLQGIAEVATA